ncbi:MAG TPA: extracellular solute-binding protein [Gryllotalpicola sp.]
MTTASSTRRLFGIASLITAAALVLAACSSSNSTAAPKSSGSSSDGGIPDTPVSLTFAGYGGAGQDGQIEAWQKPYTAAHPNVTFNNTSPAAVSTVQAQVLAGNIQWDVMMVAPFAAEQNCGTVFAPLKVNLDPKDFIPGTIGKCYVGNFGNAPILAYNKKDFPDPATAPKSIADYFDTKKFPGKRGVVSDLQDGMLEYPLLADGVKPKDLYSIDNVGKALTKWDTIKSDTIFAANVGVLQQDVASNQVSMFILVSSRLLSLEDSGMQLQPIWDTTVVPMNGFAVPKGDKHLDVIENFIEASVQPGPAAKIAELDGVIPINLNAKPDLSKSAALFNPYDKSHGGTIVPQDNDWLAKNNNQATQQMTTWLQG